MKIRLIKFLWNVTLNTLMETLKMYLYRYYQLQKFLKYVCDDKKAVALF